jgi:hypothetical protein
MAVVKLAAKVAVKLAAKAARILATKAAADRAPNVRANARRSPARKRAPKSRGVRVKTVTPPRNTSVDPSAMPLSPSSTANRAVPTTMSWKTAWTATASKWAICRK